MADNIKVTEGSGPTVATDEITIDGAKAHVQRVKMVAGAAGSGADVSSAAPLPTSDSSAQLKLEAIALLLAGTLNVSDEEAALWLQELSAQLSALGAATDAETTGNGSLIAIVKRLRAIAESGGYVVRGIVAHDSANQGNPIKVGGVARTSLVAVSANGDITDSAADKFGRRLTTTAPLDQRVSGSLNRTTNAAANVIAAPGASTAIVVTDILVVNAHATVGTKVSIRDGETAKVTGYAGPVGGGFQLSNPDGLFVATANTAIAAICGTTGADVDIFVSGFKVPA